MLGIIGGSGLYDFDDGLFEEADHAIEFSDDCVNTEYGATSSRLFYFTKQKGPLDESRCCFITRHGVDHSIPPHKINYRANIDAGIIIRR